MRQALSVAWADAAPVAAATSRSRARSMSDSTDGLVMLRGQ
jgi:hypothetical protein